VCVALRGQGVAPPFGSCLANASALVSESAVTGKLDKPIQLQMGPMGAASVYLCLTPKTYKRFVKKHGKGLRPDEWIGNGAAASTHQIDDGVCIALSVKKLRSVPIHRAAAIVSHECAHATRMIEEIMREPTRLSIEAEAYCVQYLVQECMRIALPETTKRRR
jgi:hypothetical protein